MPRSFTPTYRYLHTQERDWRVFCVGHLGYDSYDEEDSDEDTRISSGDLVYESDEDEEMLDAPNSIPPPEHPPQSSTSTSFLHRLLGVSNSTTTPPHNTQSQSRFITTSNRKRKEYHKWMELKCLRNQTVKQISAGGYHVVMLLDNGDVYTWGWGKLGQLGHGDTMNRLKPMKIKLPQIDPAPDLPKHSLQQVSSPNAQPSATARCQPKSGTKRVEPKVVRVKGGGRHTLLLSDDGRVFTFGCAEDGRLGHNEKADCLVPKEITALRGYRVVFVDSGFWHSVVATFCKRIFVFGHGEEGKLGLGDVQSQISPKEIVQLRGKGVLSASGGAWHTIILTDDHRVYTCGSHYWGQLGVGTVLKDDDYLYNVSKETGQKIIISPSRDACYTPIEVRELRDKNIVKVIAGSNFNVCLSKDGKVFTFGCGSSGKTGHGGNITVFTPKIIDSISNLRFKDVCTGSNHTLLLSVDGRVFSFGWDRYGQLGHGNLEEVDSPKEIEALKGIDIEQITAGAFFTIVATRKSTAGEKPESFLLGRKHRTAFTDIIIRN